MKLAKTTTLRIAIPASLIIAGVFVCWGTNVKCWSLISLKTCIGEHMRKLNPNFKKSPGGNYQASLCSEKKRPVFVNWRRLYWGNLGELTKPDEYFAPRSAVQTTGTENPLTIKNEVLRQFTQELRAALKAFEKRYCVKINWFKNEPTMLDVTAQFIAFWDQDYGRMKDSELKKADNSRRKGK